jgi:hypothetical protein
VDWPVVTIQKPVLSVPLWAFSPDIFPYTPWDLYAPLLIHSMAFSLQRIPSLTKKKFNMLLKFDVTSLAFFRHGDYVSYSWIAAALELQTDLTS